MPIYMLIYMPIYMLIYMPIYILIYICGCKITKKCRKTPIFEQKM